MFIILLSLGRGVWEVGTKATIRRFYDYAGCELQVYEVSPTLKPKKRKQTM